MLTDLRTIHPVADLFPMLSEEELQELADDIAEQGLHQPVILDRDGQVLDGRNRLAACELAGVEPHFTTYEGTDPVGYILSLNITRRHLAKGQLAMIAARAQEMTTKLSLRSVADSAYLNRERVRQAATVLTYAPEMATDVIAGKTPLNDAYHTAQERKRHADEEARTQAEQEEAERQREADRARLIEQYADIDAKVKSGEMSPADAANYILERERQEREEKERKAKEEKKEAEARRQRMRANSQLLAACIRNAVDGLATPALRESMVELFSNKESGVNFIVDSASIAHAIENLQALQEIWNDA